MCHEPICLGTAVVAICFFIASKKEQVKKQVFHFRIFGSPLRNKNGQFFRVNSKSSFMVVQSWPLSSDLFPSTILIFSLVIEVLF